jgi:molybdate/tungstate transport system substrate-binding protein
MSLAAGTTIAGFGWAPMKKLVTLLAAASLLLAGCGGSRDSSTSQSSGAAPPARGTVKVLYAGSLVNLMEHDLGPAFAKATGYGYQGTGEGSLQLANEIKGKVKQGDVFISASLEADNSLMGAANGDWVSWFAVFGSAPLLIGYNPNSAFAHDLTTKPWDQVITENGFRMGGTDPKLDPKGNLAAKALDQAGIPMSSIQVFPEEQLAGRLQSGQLDAGFFYSSEATELKMPTVGLGAIKLGATYTVTVLKRAPNQDGAVGFVQFLLGDDGRTRMNKYGVQTQPVAVTGDTNVIPAALHGPLGVR